jgi:hypothetical protein
MPCDTYTPPGKTQAQRDAEIKEAIAKLEAELNLGRVGVKISATGAIAFTNWSKDDRGGVSDVCAYRTLTAQNSFALRQAVQRAEAMAGRKVNPQQVAAGTHSHDGGNTWHKGH